MLALGGCASAEQAPNAVPETGTLASKAPSEATEQPEPSADRKEDGRAEVPWEDYSPDVKQRIDTMGSEQQCDLLQQEFDRADAGNEATITRTGHNNADLMSYIDEAMRMADCY